jgi:ribosomal protein S18 acetylase RimI-like enzyme
LNIKKATQKDFNKILKLKLESKEEERKYNDELEPVRKVKKHYAEYLKNDLKSNWRAVFMAIEDRQIVGFATVKIYRTLHICGYERCGFISNVFIKKECRKQGVAKKLIDQIIKWLKENDATKVSLELYQGNIPALNLYHKLGFKKYSIKMKKKI